MKRMQRISAAQLLVLALSIGTSCTSAASDAASTGAASERAPVSSAPPLRGPPMNYPQRSADQQPRATDSRSRSLVIEASRGIPRQIEIAGYFDTVSGGSHTAQGLFRDPAECRSPLLTGATHAFEGVRAVVIDGAGTVLEERLLQTAALSGGPRTRMFIGCVSVHDAARRVVVRRGEQIFLDVTASADAPVVDVVFPLAGGTVDRQKGDSLRWKVRDSDRNPIWVRFSTSHDGQVWFDHSPLGFEGEPREEMSRPSNRMSMRSGQDMSQVFLAVEASDGFWSSSAIVGPFRVLDCPAPPDFPAELDACLQRAYAP